MSKWTVQLHDGVLGVSVWAAYGGHWATVEEMNRKFFGSHGNEESLKKSILRAQRFCDSAPEPVSILGAGEEYLRDITTNGTPKKKWWQ